MAAAARCGRSGRSGSARSCVEGATADWSAVYVRESLDASAGVAALAFAAFSATMTLGRLVGDKLTDRLGRRGARSGAAALLSAAGVAGALLIADPIAATLGFALVGFGIAAIVPVVFRAASEVDGVAPGRRHRGGGRRRATSGSSSRRRSSAASRR